MEIEYIDIISSSLAPYFTRKNLSVLLGRNRRTLDYRIKALIAENILLPIKSGFYLNNVLYKKALAPEELTRYLSGALVRDSYISLEYALAFYGLLAESIYTVTCITTSKTRTIQNNFLSFRYRNIKPELYFGYTQIKYENWFYQIASPAKALFDLIYLTSLTSDRDMREFLINSRFNWEVLTKTDKVEFREIVKKSNSAKMFRVLKYL